MKVFVAGATGAIGRPLVSALVAAGHDVVGMTSSEHGLQTLEELTSLPKHYTPEEMRAAADRDRKLRLEGGRNVQNAARAAVARRYLVQSTGFFYAPGPGLASEADPLALNASPAVSANVRTYSQVEERVLGALELQGVALRYGFFYGPGTWFMVDGDIANQVRERKYPVVGSGQGVWSWVHVEDAAAATVAALECAPGNLSTYSRPACRLRPRGRPTFSSLRWAESPCGASLLARRQAVPAADSGGQCGG